MKPILLFFAFFAVSVAAALGVAGNGILGRWGNDEDGAILEFYHRDGKYFARIAMPADMKNLADAKNPDKTLRERRLDGQTVIRDLVFAGGKYTGGTVYTPRMGVTASCSIEFAGCDAIIITGRKAIISKKERWTRKKQ
jgi:uncharacterized protein (DUF2147 family)